MQWGMGVLGWSPMQFWSATPTDLDRAIQGWKVANGAEEQTAQGKPILSRSEVEELQELMDDHG